MIAQGEMVKEFEKQIAHHLGGYGTVCVGSGTAALVLSLKSLDVGVGDHVVVPALVCRNVLEAVTGNGSTPILCDVGDDWIVTYDTIKRRLTRKTKAIIVPHIFGIKADIKEIKRFGIPIIEDCAQAFGKTIHNEVIGTDGDLSVFSFQATKCLTTGEGGAVMVSTRKKHWLSRLYELRDGGDDLSRKIFSPMSDITAGIGIAQLKKYDFFLRKRFQIAGRYDRVLQNKESVRTLNLKEYSSMYFRYVVKTKKSFLHYAQKFRDQGIVVRKGIELPLGHLKSEDRKALKNAIFLFNHTVSLPIYPALTRAEILQISHAADCIFE